MEQAGVIARSTLQNDHCMDLYMPKAKRAGNTRAVAVEDGSSGSGGSGGGSDGWVMVPTSSGHVFGKFEGG